MSDELQIMLFSTVEDLWSRPTSVGGRWRVRFHKHARVAVHCVPDEVGLRNPRAADRRSARRCLEPARKDRVLRETPLRLQIQTSGGGWYRQRPEVAERSQAASLIRAIRIPR